MVPHCLKFGLVWAKLAVMRLELTCQLSEVSGEWDCESWGIERKVKKKKGENKNASDMMKIILDYDSCMLFDVNAVLILTDEL